MLSMQTMQLMLFNFSIIIASNLNRVEKALNQFEEFRLEACLMQFKRALIIPFCSHLLSSVVVNPSPSEMRIELPSISRIEMRLFVLNTLPTSDIFCTNSHQRFTTKQFINLSVGNSFSVFMLQRRYTFLPHR